MLQRIRNLIFISLICFVFISCSKGDSPQQPLSSEKSLTGIVFKASDNPGLQEDITGTITGDSVKVKFPSTISLTSLVPTIDFTGASITPANRTAQNFTTPLAYKIIAEDGSAKNFVFGVSYRTLNDSISMITVKWGVIKDSLTNNNYTFPNGGGYPNPGVYFGVAADYYDFNPNGTVSAFENNNYGSSPYQILPNGQLIFVFPFMNYQGTIEFLSLTRMTVYWSLTSANGGQYFRKLYLKR